MKASNNPFFFRELSVEDPFCDRENELKQLVSYAEGHANVVLFSPRRYGKTSLVRRVQHQLAQRDVVTVFADFFGITSIDDMAARLARAVFEVTRPKDHLFKAALKAIKSFRPVLKPDETGGVTLSVEPSAVTRAGSDVLEDTMSSLDEFVTASECLVHIALDEFQEITQLGEAMNIEGIMRAHIQRSRASWFFIGSRRSLLLAMFNDRHRPFFQSAINYELKVLPHEELGHFIVKRFLSANKECSDAQAGAIASAVGDHPYYSQKLAFFAYERAEHAVTEADVKGAFETLVASEQPLFEAVVQGLAPQQITAFKAIAREPTPSIFAIDYMKRHGLGSTGGAQGALKKLTLLDLIEQDGKKCWHVVDPVFRMWLLK